MEGYADEVEAYRGTRVLSLSDLSRLTARLGTCGAGYRKVWVIWFDGSRRRIDIEQSGAPSPQGFEFPGLTAWRRMMY